MGGGEFLGRCLYHVRETPILNREGTTKNGRFCSVVEKGRGLDPKYPPSCAPGPILL